MSDAARQALLVCVGGLVLAGVVAALTRRRMITLRYALGWLAIALGGIFGALLSFLVRPISNFLGLTATGLLLAIASVTLLGVSILLSVAVSQLQAQLRDLAEAHALAATQLRELSERQVDG